MRVKALVPLRRKIRHGLETVIGALEDAEEQGVRSGHHCGLRCSVGSRARTGAEIGQSPVAAATTMETGLFEIQG